MLKHKLVDFIIQFMEEVDKEISEMKLFVSVAVGKCWRYTDWRYSWMLEQDSWQNHSWHLWVIQSTFVSTIANISPVWLSMALRGENTNANRCWVAGIVLGSLLEAFRDAQKIWMNNMKGQLIDHFQKHFNVEFPIMPCRKISLSLGTVSLAITKVSQMLPFAENRTT